MSYAYTIRNMYSEAEALLYTLCVELGFCLQAPHCDRLCDDPPDTVSAFADAVVLAEGMNVTTIDRHLYRQVRDCIAEAFQRAQIRMEIERTHAR